ncbi:MAG: GAF domain-containing protein, partial [Deltaproteobacteria bacterium]|nr:GAF domain-containing protein [Deltaproteobacteria bacterium]
MRNRHRGQHHALRGERGCGRPITDGTTHGTNPSAAAESALPEGAQFIGRGQPVFKAGAGVVLVGRMPKASVSKAQPRKRAAYSATQWQKAISHLGRAMASKLSLDAVFREFAVGIKGYIPYDRLMINRLDPQSRVAGLFLLSSVPQDSLDADPEFSERGGSVTDRVVREHKTFIREDSAAQREFETDEYLSQMGFRSYICLPLVCWDRVVGSFHVASNKAKAYGKRESAFLESVAEWLAIAMENARFFQQTHRLLEEQGVLHQLTAEINVLDLDALLQRLTKEVLNIFKADCAFVRLREADGSYRIRAISGLDLPPYHEASLENQVNTASLVQERQPLFIRDLRQQGPSAGSRTVVETFGFRSYLGVPILLKGEGIGALVVLSRTVKDFTERDVFFLQQLAAEAAVAIHHALLFEELKRLNDDLERANRETSQFRARLAHEVRTPLSVITGLLEIMNMGTTGSLTDQQKAALSKIHDQCEALLRLLNDLLNFSRLKAGAIPVEISPVIMD